MADNNLEQLGFQEGFAFLTDIQDDLEAALADGKISKVEALKLFSIILRHAARFGLNVLAMKAGGSNPNTPI